MAACVQCGSYTKFNGGLCYSCYQSENANEVEVLEEKKEEVTTGLSEKDRNYRYSILSIMVLKPMKWF